MMKLVFTHCSALGPLQVCCVLAVSLSMIDDYAFYWNFCLAVSFLFINADQFIVRIQDVAFLLSDFPLALVNLEYSCNGVVRVFLLRRCSILNMYISVVGIIARSLYFQLS